MATTTTPSLLKKVSLRQTLRFEIDEFEGKAYKNNKGTIIINIGCQSHPLSWWKGRNAEELIDATYDAEIYEDNRRDWETQEEYEGRTECHKARANRAADMSLKLLLAREQVLAWIEEQLA